MKKLTKKEFIKRSTIKHNNKYDYSLVKYIHTKSKVKIICPIHGVFKQVPNSHLKGIGCKKCGNLITRKKLNLGESIFIKKANIIHNNKYDYSLVNYVNNLTKIKILCPIHNIFNQRPGLHLLGEGCKKCYIELIKNKEKFIIQANIIYKNKYNYSLLNYLGSRKKSIIICNIHGNFKTTPDAHLKGSECKLCDKHKRKMNFIKKANIIHDFKYNYDIIDYITNKIKINIICMNHGIFPQTPSNHLQGHDCPKCKSLISIPETEWLNYLNISNNYRHKTIIINKKKYNLDAFDPITNTIYEFYGDYWHGNIKIFNQNKIHPVNKKSYGDLYFKTIQREQELKNIGYNIISIWESEWNEIKNNKGNLCQI